MNSLRRWGVEGSGDAMGQGQRAKRGRNGRAVYIAE
jgi:hypothetical protein